MLHFLRNHGLCIVCVTPLCFLTASRKVLSQPQVDGNLYTMSGKVEVAAPKRLHPVIINYNKTKRYAVVTNDGSKFFDNDTFFHKIIDLIVKNVDVKLRNDIINIFEKANARYSKKNERRIFYLCENELEDFWNSISDSNQKPIYSTHVSDASRFLFDTITESKMWDYLLKKKEFCSLEECASFEVIKRMTREKPSDPDNGDQMLILGQKPFVYYTEALIAMQNIETFSQKNPNRRIFLRTMCEWRTTDTDNWHLFANEASEGIMIALKRADKWRNEVNPCEVSKKSYAITMVNDFKKSCERFDIKSDSFLLVPDVQFTKDWFELPLDMSYQCAWVNASDGEKVYHKSQAMYLITQRVAANIIGMESPVNTPPRSDIYLFRYKILNILWEMKDGYTSAEKIDQIIEKWKKDSYYQENQARTALFECCKRPFNDIMKKSEFIKYVSLIETKIEAEILNEKWLIFLGIGQDDLPESLKIWKVRYVFMLRLINFFFVAYADMRDHVFRAWTLNITPSVINSFDGFDGILERLHRAYRSNFNDTTSQKSRSIYQFGDDEMMTMMNTKKENSEFSDESISEIDQTIGDSETLAPKNQLISAEDSVSPEKYRKMFDVLRGEMSNYSEEVELLKMDIQTKTMEYERSISEANKEKRIWFDKHATVLAENVNLKETVSARGTRINELQKDLKRMKEEARSERAKAEKANKNLNAMEKEVNSIKSNFERYATKLEEIEKRNKNSESSANNMKNEYDKILKQLDTMKKKSIGLEEEMKRKTSSFERMREEYEKDRFEHAKFINELTNEKEQLMLRVEELTENSAVLLSQNNRDEYVSQLERKLAMIENWYRQGLECFDTPSVATVTPVESIDNSESSASTSSEVSLTVERCKLVEKRMGQYDEILKLGCEELVENVEFNVKKHAEVRGRPRNVASANSEMLAFKKTFKRVIDSTQTQFVIAQNDITTRIDDLSDILEFPKFSDRFMQTYEKLMKNKQDFKNEQKKSIGWQKVGTVDNEEVELEDPECVICTEDMDENDRCLTKCSICCRMYHNKCLSEWLQQNSTCPVCRSSLPDPKSFPSLN